MSRAGSPTPSDARRDTQELSEEQRESLEFVRDNAEDDILAEVCERMLQSSENREANS